MAFIYLPENFTVLSFLFVMKNFVTVRSQLIRTLFMSSTMRQIISSLSQLLCEYTTRNKFHQQNHVILDRHHMYKFVCYYCISYTYNIIPCAYISLHRSSNNNNNNNNNILSLYTRRPKRTVPVAFFLTISTPYFLMCVQFPHSQNNHRTLVHVSRTHT